VSGEWPLCEAAGCRVRVQAGGLCSTCAAVARAAGHVFVFSGTVTPQHAQVWWRCSHVCPDGQPCGALEHQHARQAAMLAAVGVGPYKLGPPAAKLRRDARPTSAAAAASVALRSGTQRFRVMQALAAAGADGATDEELGQATNLELNSVRPRRLELVEAGYALDTGDTRPTRQGLAAAVWVATLDGLDTLDAALRGA
jgi:hypothetical protein